MLNVSTASQFFCQLIFDSPQKYRQVSLYSIMHDCTDNEPSAPVPNRLPVNKGGREGGFSRETAVRLGFDKLPQLLEEHPAQLPVRLLRQGYQHQRYAIFFRPIRLIVDTADDRRSCCIATDLSQETAINAYDIVSTLQALGMLKYWKGKHLVLLKQVSAITKSTGDSSKGRVGCSWPTVCRSI